MASKALSGSKNVTVDTVKKIVRVNPNAELEKFEQMAIQNYMNAGYELRTKRSSSKKQGMKKVDVLKALTAAQKKTYDEIAETEGNLAAYRWGKKQIAEKDSE